MRQEEKKYKSTVKTEYQIMDAFIRLGETKDIDRISVKSITEEAQISRGTFYEYFSDINEIITHIESFLLDEMPVYKAGPAKRKIMTLSPEECRKSDWEKAWFCYYRKHCRPLNVLLGPHGDPLFYGKFKAHLVDQIDARMREDGFPEDTMRKYFRSICGGTFIALAREWTTQKYHDEITLENLALISCAIRAGGIYLSMNSDRVAITQKEKDHL